MDDLAIEIARNSLQVLFENNRRPGDGIAQTCRILAWQLGNSVSPSKRWGWQYIHQVIHKKLAPSKSLILATERLSHKKTSDNKSDCQSIPILTRTGLVEPETLISIPSKKYALPTCHHYFLPQKTRRNTMPTYPRPETPNEYERKIAEGRGAGEGADYQSWFLTHEISSLGDSNNPYSYKMQRPIHLVSKGELKLWCILEYSLKVKEFYEQYLLDLEKTSSIAEEHDIPHPKIKGEYKAISTDFLAHVITCSGDIEYHALSFKYSKVFQPDRSAKSSNTLEDLHALEKLEIERLYWLELGHKFRIITELDIPDAVFMNLFKAQYSVKPRKTLNEQDIHDISAYLTRRVTSENVPLRQITSECDRQLGYPDGSGTALGVVWHLIANHKWNIDLNEIVDPSKPLKLISTSI